jgi:hypothetical protein
MLRKMAQRLGLNSIVASDGADDNIRMSYACSKENIAEGVERLVGEAGLEPASREAQDPKSCVSANFTTRPEYQRKEMLVCYVTSCRRIGLPGRSSQHNAGCPASFRSFHSLSYAAAGFDFRCAAVDAW